MTAYEKIVRKGKKVSAADFEYIQTQYATAKADAEAGLWAIQPGAHEHASLYSPLDHTHVGGAVIPSGVIVIWSGLRANIPIGWYLCDGDNGTPDLRDKFICSVTGVEEAGLTGGSATLIHTGSAVGDHAAQTHSGTAVGEHAAQTHTGSAVDNHAALVHADTAVANHTNVAVPATATAAGKVGTSTANLATNLHTHTIATITHSVTQPSNHAAMTHAVTQPSQHGALVHDITQPSDHPILEHAVTQPNDHADSRPPYYKLCFIMKG
jgi:hypothetical protein